MSSGHQQGLRQGHQRWRWLRYLSFTVAVVLALTAAWQFAQAGYIHGKAALAQILIARAWAETPTMGTAVVKPWPWADTAPVARLRQPRLGIDLMVLAGATGRTLAFGPGHQDGSAAPGAPGTSIIAGHRDTHFAFMEKLKTGDSLQISGRDGIVHRYKIRQLAVVHKDDAWIDLDRPGRHLVLYTCFPFNARRAGGPLRYVALAEAVTAASDARRSRP